MSLLAVVILAVLALAACGGDDDTTASTDGAADSENTATGTPLRVAVMADTTGVAAGDQAATIPVVEAWVEKANAEGGVAGHPVEVVSEDTKGDTPTATRIAEDLIADESVVGIVFEDAETEASVGQLLSKSGLPVIGGLGFDPSVWTGLPGWFNVTTSNPALTETGAVAAVDAGLTTLVAASCAESPGCAEFVEIIRGISEGYGLAFEGQIGITAAQPNYTAECLEFIRAGADYIFAVAAPADARQVGEDCIQQGYEGYIGASAGTVSPDLYDNVAPLTGGLNAFPWFVDAPPVEEFREAMADAGIEEGEFGTPHATAAWTTMELFGVALEADAAKLSDSPTREEVVAAYGRISNETLGGLLPEPLTFTAGKPSPPMNCFWLYTQEEVGELEASFEPTCAKG